MLGFAFSNSAKRQKLQTFVHLALLLALSLRVVFGAPCCLPAAGADGGHHEAHSGHSHGSHQAVHASSPSEDGRPSASDPTANPCCSACSPPLPSEPVKLAAGTALRSLPEPTSVRSLATRPPYPAYEATGPPALI